MKLLSTRISRNQAITLIIFIFSSALPMAIYAACPSSNKIFSFVAEIQSGCGSFGTTTASSFLNKLKTNGLRSLTGMNYTGSEVLNIDGNFNRLPISLSFPNLGSSGEGALLVLKIPDLGITKAFQGDTRDKSRKMMENYIKKGNIIGEIMKKQAANSPYSPIAGPGGLIPTLTASSFNENFTNSATNIAGPRTDSNEKLNNLIGVALNFNSMKVLDTTTKVTSLPLSYTIRNDIDPRRLLTISLPLTMIDTDGAKSYSGALGVSYRVPMSDNWTLTPNAMMGTVGSKDLASMSSAIATSITSTYILELDNFDLTMGNQIGYSRTVKVKSGDYSANPNIDNITFRNGLMLSQPVIFNDQKMSVEYSIIDTRYTGTAFYVDNTQEIGITLGTNKRAYSARSFLRGGVTFIRGKDTNGVTANFGYWF
ncbi:conserved hypothetical protein [Gammaproteobacteria bacterium]